MIFLFKEIFLSNLEQPSNCLHIADERLPCNHLLIDTLTWAKPHLSFHFVLPPFYSAILKPDSHLCLCQAKLGREASPLLSRYILVDNENVFQLVQLMSRKDGATSLWSYDFINHETSNAFFRPRICENGWISFNNNNRFQVLPLSILRQRKASMSVVFTIVSSLSPPHFQVTFCPLSTR